MISRFQPLSQNFNTIHLFEAWYEYVTVHVYGRICVCGECVHLTQKQGQRIEGHNHAHVTCLLQAMHMHMHVSLEKIPKIIKRIF